MTHIFSVVYDYESFPISAVIDAERSNRIKHNWWRLDVMDRSEFEDQIHTLESVDDDYKPASVDCVPDICQCDTAAWAFGERTWDWLPALRATGCRVAERVVAPGDKRFKLVSPSAVVDLLDHDESRFTRHDEKTYSSVPRAVLYHTQQLLPLWFRVLIRHPGPYNGVTKSPSIKTFATDEFVKHYTERDFTGLQFNEVGRSHRPAVSPEPAQLVIFEARGI